MVLRHRRLRRTAALLAAVALPAAVALTATEALAATIKTVTIKDDKFTPNTLAVAQGDTVRFTWAESETHSVTDASGMALYDSGFKGSGTYDRTYTAAGSYPYRCRLHFSMSGTVNVAMKAAPATGTAATQFTIRWSTVAAPAGYVHDVKIKRPGTTAFVDWKPGITAPSASFKADAGAGTYQFQARLRQTASGKATAFSPARSIVVS